jgi:GPH family glycoside/pentoside/hexuronide:cation symporter
MQSPASPKPRVVRSEVAENSIVMSTSQGGDTFEDDDHISTTEKAGNDGSSVTNADRLPLRTKIYLGIGESVQGIYVVISGYYLNTFLLETACIDPMYVGLIQAIQGGFDAVNDPLIGWLSDRTRTRWGRRRPWLLFAPPFLAVSYFALWNALPPHVPQFMKFLYALVVHMCVSVGITSVQVQIGALVPELTDDYDERTSVSAFRLFIGNFVGFLCALCHNQVINRGEEYNFPKANRYRISGAMFSSVLLMSGWVTFAGIKERFQPRQETRKKMSIWKELKCVLRSRSFRCVVGAYLCGPTAVVLVQSNIYMFCKYCLKDAGAIEVIIPAVQGTALVSMPIWALVSRRFGKKAAYFLGGTILFCSVASISFLDGKEQREDSLGAAYGVATLIGFSGPVVYLVPYSMLPDVIEEDELRTGKRREGLFAGFFTIVLKLSVTGALTLTNFILKAGGYQAPEAGCNKEPDKMMQETLGIPDIQPQLVVSLFRLLCGVIPASFILLAMVCVWYFPINRTQQLAMAKLAAQARLERCIAQSETSSVTSTHSPRDVKELSNFIKDFPNEKVEETGDKVLEAMTRELCDAKYLEYIEQYQGARQVTFEDEQPKSRTGTAGFASSDMSSAQSALSHRLSKSMTPEATMTDARTSESTKLPGQNTLARIVGRQENDRVATLKRLVDEKKAQSNLLMSEIRILEEGILKEIAKKNSQGPSSSPESQTAVPLESRTAVPLEQDNSPCSGGARIQL